MLLRHAGLQHVYIIGLHFSKSGGKRGFHADCFSGLHQALNGPQRNRTGYLKRLFERVENSLSSSRDLTGREGEGNGVWMIQSFQESPVLVFTGLAQTIVKRLPSCYLHGSSFL
ncbi:MAG TPA: hypothetical protein VKR06_29580 [Ktedonosporobacter sp.]|nr:hypothetical protein [Ktedonosporobacter sp.]